MLSFLAGVDKPMDRGLRDETIAAIASDIETDEHVDYLGIVLGFSRAEINRYITTNLLTGRKTFEGTKNMLFNWRLRTSPTEHRAKLKQALADSGLTLLAERYLSASAFEDSGNFLFLNHFVL